MAEWGTGGINVHYLLDWAKSGLYGPVGFVGVPRMDTRYPQVDTTVCGRIHSVAVNMMGVGWFMGGARELK